MLPGNPYLLCYGSLVIHAALLIWLSWKVARLNGQRKQGTLDKDGRSELVFPLAVTGVVVGLACTVLEALTLPDLLPFGLAPVIISGILTATMAWNAIDHWRFRSSWPSHQQKEQQ